LGMLFDFKGGCMKIPKEGMAGATAIKGFKGRPHHA